MGQAKGMEAMCKAPGLGWITINFPGVVGDAQGAVVHA